MEDKVLKNCTGSSKKGSQHEMRKWTQSSISNQNLFALDTSWQEENPFSPMEYHWVYQPHSKASPISVLVYQRKTNSVLILFCIFVGALFLREEE